VSIEYEGDVAALNVKPLSQVALMGVLRPQLDSVNMVNAPVIARERGIEVAEVKHERASDYNSMIRLTVTTEKYTRAVTGTLFGGKHPRIVDIKGIEIEAEFAPHMLYITNDDKPGFIGRLGTILGENKVNIATFHLGRDKPGGSAIALVQVDQPLSKELMDERLPPSRASCGAKVRAAGALGRRLTRRRPALGALPLSERHCRRGEADRERADIEPRVARIGAVERGRRAATGRTPSAEAHASAEDRAEHRAHDARAEIFARQDGVERHHAAVGHAEHDRERVELAELVDEEIGAGAQRLHHQAADQHRLGALPVGQHAQQQAAAETRQAGQAVDANRRHRGNAAADGKGHHVEDRPRMRRAAGEVASASAANRRAAPRPRSCVACASAATGVTHRAGRVDDQYHRRTAHQQRRGHDQERPMPTTSIAGRHS
jgi:hypothetical protein